MDVRLIDQGLVVFGGFGAAWRNQQSTNPHKTTKNKSYPAINNGVYKCGFATTQEAYDAAFDELAAGLDRLEAILAKQRYVAGDGAALTEGARLRLCREGGRLFVFFAAHALTHDNTRNKPNLADIRLFVTLVRWDDVCE